jgi:hypothetical protein
MKDKISEVIALLEKSKVVIYPEHPTAAAALAAINKALPHVSAEDIATINGIFYNTQINLIADTLRGYHNHNQH